MGQDWKTLLLVGVVAAIAGWVLVRQLNGGSRTRHAGPPTVGPVATQPTEAVAVAPSDGEEVAEAPPTPARVATGATPGEDGGSLAYVERDLEALAQALVKDERIEERVMPRINDALEIPSPMSYRRAPDFWQPALRDPEGANP